MKVRYWKFVVLTVVAGVLACNRDNDSVKAGSAPQNQPAPSQEAALPDLKFPPDNAPPPSIDAERAMKYVKEIVKLGPRPIGSENHKKVENYILDHLKGDDVESDSFVADTVEGKFPVRNILAKFPGSKDGIIVIASHYDTNYPLRNTSFIGANDGASTSALLLEFANQLHGKKLDGYSIWLLWTDAEEAVRNWTETDSVYGARHLAGKWQQDGTAKKIKAFLLTDMIGDADLNVEHEANSTPWLEAVVYEAAKRLGYQSHFYDRYFPIEDDHLPFLRMGIPAADLIDLNYGYNNVFHHTTQDTVDKLSPNSLQIVGSVVLESIRILNNMNPLPPKVNAPSASSH